MQPALRLFLVLLLGGWLGASVFFSFVAAPAIFQLSKTQVLTRDQAGDVAAAMLKRYFASATVVLILALICSGLLAFGTARPAFTRCAMIVVIALFLTLFDGYVWAPKVHKIREQRRAAPSAQLDSEFGRAHAISAGINLLVILGTAAAFVAAARTE